jgi:type I restriction enzyme, S subunit
VTGAVSGDTGLVPKLRFPRFKGDWVKRRLGDAAKVTTGSRDTQNRVENGSYPFFVRSDTIERINSFAFDGEAVLTSGDGVGVGRNIHYINGRFDFHQRVYAVYDFSKFLTGPFFYQFFKENFLKRVMRLSAKNSVDSVRMSMITDMVIATPTLPEQQKIADFLATVDARMGELRQKRELLAAYKRGVMQQIFTQTLRFKKDDGSAFPDWEEKRLGEVFTLGRGQVLAMPKVSTTQSATAMYPVYSSQTRSNGLAGYFDQYLFEDAITWTTDGANAGDTKFRTGRFCCTNVCGVLQNGNGNCNAFMAELINSVSKQYVSYVGNPKLMNNVMASIRVSFPHPTEQQKIADFLTALDAKIETVNAKITQTEAFKKGLLQKMFV